MTPRQRQVAELAAAGFQNKEIAAELNISVRTVKFHLGEAMLELGVRSRVELIGRITPRQTGDPAAWQRLSDRERTIALLLVSGMTIEGVARRLRINRNTCSQYLWMVRRILQVPSNIALAAYVIRNGLDRAQSAPKLVAMGGQR